MRYIRWTLLIFLIFFVQIQLSTFLNIPLNLLIILVYYYALKKLSNRDRSIYYGWTKDMKITSFGALIGLIEDIISGSLIGISAFSKGTLGFLISQAFNNIFFRWTPLLGCIIIVALTFIDNIIIVGFRKLFSLGTINIVSIVEMILVQAIINLPFGIILKANRK